MCYSGVVDLVFRGCERGVQGSWCSGVVVFRSRVVVLRGRGLQGWYKWVMIHSGYGRGKINFMVYWGRGID